MGLRDLLGSISKHTLVRYSGECRACGAVTNIVCSKCNNRVFRMNDSSCSKCGKTVDTKNPAYSKCIKCGKQITMTHKLDK